ncbi:MAG: IS1096 element passenger TnpR family protein [Acidimicrobiales bacterium]
MAKAKLLVGARVHPSGPLLMSIDVSLRSAGDRVLEPPPERSLIASYRHTFADLALAIDEAFGRWELGRLREFEFDDGTRVGDLGQRNHGPGCLDYRRARLQRLRVGERFSYTFHSGDGWVHACTCAGPVDLDDVRADHPGHPVVYQSRIALTRSLRSLRSGES